MRNFWGEYTLDQRFRLRIGKMYRKFGLYNELLDAVPVYFGIEPPELFDKDHLIVSRTTIFMAHGSFDLGSDGSLNYAITTDNGEGGASTGGLPLGWDLKYKIGTDFVIGTSGYTSGGHTTSDVGMGEGSPRSGVLPWMERDKFSVWGTYGEAQLFDRLMLQGAFWRAAHRGRRDPEAVVGIIQQTELMPRQLGRFLLDPAGAVAAENVRRNAKYTIATWYIRSGYSFDTALGEIALYGQWDKYKNPETIKQKRFGGDNEAGASDDGAFQKSTVGVIFRPLPQVAAKLDQSFHFFRLNGQGVNYPEIRFDVSFTFGL